MFDTFSTDDIIVAFFPCTRFEAQISLWFRGKSYSQKNWSDIDKLVKAMSLQEELTYLYLLICKMFVVCIRKGLRLVVENPRSKPHYLTSYFPIEPSVIDNDRSLNGDEQVKSTQYWFVNCKPENNIMVDCQTERKSLYTTAHGGVKEGSDGLSTTVVRSMINPRYANWFIRTYLMTLEE